jgi:hypothetical protein
MLRLLARVLGLGIETADMLVHEILNERTSRIYAQHDPRYLRRVSDVMERRRGGDLAPLALN